MSRLLTEEAGFTLIEIIIVVVIMGFLASLVGPELMGRVSQSRRTTAKNQLDSFGLALDNYKLDTGRYPTTEQGLKALIEKPSIPPIPSNWIGSYLEKKEIPTDPWGNEYHYRCPGEHNPNKYDLWSLGADGKQGGSGSGADITNW